MTSDLDVVLKQYRDNAKTEREKGTYFENLIQSFLGADPRYTEQYSTVLTYAEWARINDQSENDAGGDIDSFMTASGKSCFRRSKAILEL